MGMSDLNFDDDSVMEILREHREIVNVARIVVGNLDNVIEAFSIPINLDALIKAAQEKVDIGVAKYKSNGYVVANVEQGDFGVKAVYIPGEGIPQNGEHPPQILLHLSVRERTTGKLVAGPYLTDHIDGVVDVVLQNPKGGTRGYPISGGTLVDARDIISGTYIIGLKRV